MKTQDKLLYFITCLKFYMNLPSKELLSSLEFFKLSRTLTKHLSFSFCSLQIYRKTTIQHFATKNLLRTQINVFMNRSTKLH